MKAMINQNHNRIRCYQRQMPYHEEDTRRRVSVEHLNQLKGFLNSRSREKCLNKIQNLREKKSTLLARDNHQLEDNTVHNFSSRQLTTHEVSLLRRDSGFKLEDAKVTDFLGSLDPVRIEETEKTQVRQTVAMWSLFTR